MEETMKITSYCSNCKNVTEHDFSFKTDKYFKLCCLICEKYEDNIPTVGELINALSRFPSELRILIMAEGTAVDIERVEHIVDGKKNLICIAGG